MYTELKDGGGSDIEIIYIPATQTFFISAGREYYEMEAAGTLSIDNTTVILKSVLCKFHDHWPLRNGREGEDARGTGGIDIFLQNLETLKIFDITTKLVKNMFGESYEFEIPENVTTASEECYATEKVRYNGVNNITPWGLTIGLIDSSSRADNAATVIQKMFRGWQARIKYRYNPNTTLGKYCTLEMFNQLMHT